jgi:hypothetical protein
MEEQEGPSPQKRASWLTPSKQNLLVYKCGIFVEYMIYASEEEKESAKLLLITPDRTTDDYEWVFNAYREEFALRDLHSDAFVVRITRQGIPLDLLTKRIFKGITRFFWTHNPDDSIRLLTRDTLISILNHLTDPFDLLHCMEVSHLFYSAATAPLLYEQRIKRLLAAGRVDRFPFKNETLRPHQRFFWLTLSIEEDFAHYVGREIFKMLQKSENTDLMIYLCSIVGTLPKDDVLYYDKDGKRCDCFNTKNELSLILFDDRYFYSRYGAQHFNFPVEEFRFNVKKILKQK